MPLIGFWWLPVLLSISAVIMVALSVKRVQQGMECTVERFGRYTRTLSPGLNFIIPILDKIGARLNMMEQMLDMPTQEVFTRDNAMIKVDGVAFFRIVNAAKAVYAVSNLQSAIMNLTIANIRSVLGSMDLDDLLSQRDKINSQFLHGVDEATAPWGVKVTRIEIKSITPQRDLVEAMGHLMKVKLVSQNHHGKDAAFRLMKW
ncbi:PHB domain-containing protein QmcA (fragment) [Gammaproteobacteria bacterium]